jgi:hypothetical protein
MRVADGEGSCSQRVLCRPGRSMTDRTSGSVGWPGIRNRTRLLPCGSVRRWPRCASKATRLLPSMGAKGFDDKSRSVQLAPRPWQNGPVERLIGLIRRNNLDHTMLLVMGTSATCWQVSIAQRSPFAVRSAERFRIGRHVFWWTQRAVKFWLELRSSIKLAHLRLFVFPL